MMDHMKHNSDEDYTWKMDDTIAIAERYLASLTPAERADMIIVGGPNDKESAMSILSASA